nr:MAG TPA: Head Tail Connector Protein [Caudoviricetes sp.]
MCCCALAEQHQIIENAKVQSMSGGEVKSQTVGAWSKTYASGAETAEAARKTLENIAMDYLAWTGLLYRGGQRCVPTCCDRL